MANNQENNDTACVICNENFGVNALRRQYPCCKQFACHTCVFRCFDANMKCPYCRKIIPHNHFENDDEVIFVGEFNRKNVILCANCRKLKSTRARFMCCDYICCIDCTDRWFNDVGNGFKAPCPGCRELTKNHQVEYRRRV